MHSAIKKNICKYMDKVKGIYESSPYVRELKDKHFKITKLDGSVNIESKNDKLILFYADWCPHCRDTSFVEMINVLAKNLKKYNIETTAYNCAGSDNAQDNSEYIGIRGYPTIAYQDVNSSKVLKHQGPRDLKSIIEFLINSRK